jgi:hypothetical protein
MSRVECPSQAWERHIAGEEDAADAAMALEKEVLEEAGYPNIEELLDIWTKDFALDTLEDLISSVVSAAYNKGYAQAGKDRIDGQAEYEFEQEKQRIDKKYQVACYIRVPPAIRESLSYEDAISEKEHFEAMQPENEYRIEEYEEDDITEEP